MNWADHVLDFLHRLWWEITHRVGNVWGRLRPWLQAYLRVIFTWILVFLAGAGIVLLGTLADADWVILFGGLALLGAIVAIGVVGIPAVLGINIIGAVFRRLTGGRP